MKEINLTQGYVARVDDSDYDRVTCFKWRAQVHRHRDGSIRKVYAVRSIPVPDGQTAQLMHRFLCDVTDPEIEVDHRDGDGLNNIGKNLRIATPQQNVHNRRLNRDSSSGFKGVGWHVQVAKWRVRIRVNGKSLFLGLFPADQLEAAARAYDAAAIKLHGKFARLNFPKK